MHAVYDALLARLVLSQAHREQLRHRRLPDAEIDRRLYRSLPIRGRACLARDLSERFGAETLLSVPGFVTKDRDGKNYLTIAGSAGLLIPVRDLAGRIVAVKVRRDDAGDGPRYSYLSSAKYGGPGPGSPIHVAIGTATPAAKVRLTEGELKADVAMSLSGTPTISVPGVAGWSAAISVLHRLVTKSVLIAFDADAAENPHVARALSDCLAGLEKEGFAVEIEKWDAVHKGIDDLLAAGLTSEVLTGDAANHFVAERLALATAGEPPPLANPLGRLDNVLAEGGAEGLFRDEELLKSLASLAENDPGEYACKRARLKSAGFSLRDFDRAIAPHRQEIRSNKPPLTSAGEYKASGERIIHIRSTKGGPVEVPLCNFNARIVEQVTVDDGAEASIRLVVEGSLFDGTPLSRVEILAEKFGWMEWVIPKWGTRPVVAAGASTRDHLRCAMQMLSGDVPRRMIYGHLGWRKIGEQWAYLHAGGAIGANGTVAGVEVSLPDTLARYVLPVPPSGEELREAVRASLDLLSFGPPRLVIPLLSAVYRTVLSGADFAIHLAGQSGVFKSEIASLMQQHYGAGMDSRHLPGSWSSTANSLESIAFACKDALLVIDDFAPSGSPNDMARLHREAERLLRAQGNTSGRQRMRSDGTLRPARPPRGLILSTGEDVPRGQSIRARLLNLEASKGDFGPPPPAPNPVLSKCQQDAANGLYAASMAGFIVWLARQYDAVRDRLASERSELRDRASGEGQHARTPGIIADLALGLRYFLNFAEASGAIDATRRHEFWERGWSALCEAGSSQAGHIESAEPTGHFLRLLNAALASGRAHIAATDGGRPETPSAWGWRREGNRDGSEWSPQGRRVGWLDGEQLYLEPDAAYATAQSLASEQGESLTVSAPTLRRRLKERGLLAGTDTKRETLTLRRVLQGASRNVLHLNSSSLCAKPDIPDNDRENAGEMSGFECRAACRETQNPTANPTTNPTANTEENGLIVGFVGSEVGRDAPREKNNSGGAYYAAGESHESTLTPFDICSDEDVQPIRQPPNAGRKPRRRKGYRAPEPDLFANRENRRDG
jgi:hypothetical protein